MSGDLVTLDDDFKSLLLKRDPIKIDNGVTGGWKSVVASGVGDSGVGKLQPSSLPPTCLHNHLCRIR